MRACLLANVNTDYGSCARKLIIRHRTFASSFIVSVAQSITATPFSEAHILSQKGYTYSSRLRKTFATSRCLLETPRPLRAPMAASSSFHPISRDLLVNIGRGSSSRHVFALEKPALVSFAKTGFNLPYCLAYGLLLTDLALNTHLSESRSFSSRCYANGAAPDVSLTDEQLGVSTDSPPEFVIEIDLDSSIASTFNEKISEQATMKLISGSCYLPHPDKVKTGGEDAHFICEDKRVIGVADGVGGWADVGIDAGEYSRQLMSNSVSSINNESEASIDPLKVLEKAYADTKAQGSSTACIISLNGQGIRAINLGDSGFVVIRDGSTVFRSPPQQYGFNFPFQLGNDAGADVPRSGQVFEFPVKAGDVIVAGTDGLFDNLYNNEISAIVVSAMRAHLEPHVTAQKIATYAQERALDRTRQTPFSAAAQESGYRYYGGKLDDITVVVSYVTETSCNSSERWWP